MTQHPATDGGARNGEYLVVRGAREHNLQNIDVEIPCDRLTVITGPRGVGPEALPDHL